MVIDNYIGWAPEAWAVPVGLVIAGLAACRVWLVVLGATLLGLALVFYRGANTRAADEASQAPPTSVASPCEGRVIGVRRLPDGGLHVAVFLNVHNVHVQYVPVEGVVEGVWWKAGTFHPAYLFEKSALNERMETVLRTRWGPVRVVQIAGLVARRCVSFVRRGQRLERGAPLGLIKFGSRVDVWLPAGPKGVEAVVAEGEAVRVGQRIARFGV